MSHATLTAAGLAALLGPDPTGGDGPAYRLLATRLRTLIGDGRVPSGARLPSERQLTDALAVSRTTVTRAYAVLRDSGYLTSRAGSGSVARVPGEPLPTHGPLLSRPAGDDVIDLTYAALPATPGVLEAYERALTELPRHLAVPGYHPVGLSETRAAVARWFERRGLPTDPDQIVVTNGANAALAAVTAALAKPGQHAVMETPTYPNAIHTLRAAGTRPIGVPLAGDDWDLTSIRRTLARSRAVVGYALPDFHNPTGALLSETGRAELADMYDRAGAWLVVDETFADLALDGQQQTGPTALHGAGRVISIGGTSKAFWGGLRVGWARLPQDPDLVDRVVRARHNLDLGTPVLEQLVAATLLDDAATLVPRRVEILRAQRSALVDALRNRLPEWQFRMPSGGVNLWVTLPKARSSALAAAGTGLGLRLAAGGRFAVDGGFESHLRLPYTLPPDRLIEAVERMALAWASTAEAGGPQDPWPPLVA